MNFDLFFSLFLLLHIFSPNVHIECVLHDSEHVGLYELKYTNENKNLGFCRNENK